jgi:hypothetical protein
MVKMTTTDRKRAAKVERARQLHAELKAQQQRVASDPDAAAQFAALQARLGRLSVHNVLLVLAQRPDASAVAGFRQWQKLGRQVRRGEHAIRIFGFSQVKVKPKAGEKVVPDAETPTRTVFPVLSVFDIAQTDPIA